MIAPCEALILEDDPAQAEPILDAMREVHLEPVHAHSPAHAMRRLRHHHPVLAVLDLDMSMSPEPEALPTTVDAVLRSLYEGVGGCFVIVYSVRADDILERKRIEGLHPLVMFVSKLDGEQALVDRIRRMMGVRFAGLVVRKGLTSHESTHETFQHRVGVSLVLGATLSQEVLLDESDARAARRMNEWLIRIGSPVRVVDLGRRHYALHVTPEPGQCG